MEKKKNGFGSALGFILSAAGSAVGLGNLWRFPAETAKNGGAAFVLIYIICVLLIGFVTMMCEFHIGRRAAANPVSAYKKIHPALGWFGLCGVMIPAIIICYYGVLGGYTVKYTVSSFTGNAGILLDYSLSTWQVVLFTAIFMLLAVIIIMAGVKSGIEKMSKVLMPTLFLILVAVAIYSLCLGEGVKEGLAFFLKPDFSKVTFASVLAAMGQAFFSLSLGMGTMIAYGSYTGKEINMVKSTAMICVFDTLVALLAGLAIFPAVAHFNPALIAPGAKVPQGLSLMFSILPDVFASMGWVGKLVSFFFFAMVVIAALTSVVSLVEVVTQFIIQRFRVRRTVAATAVALVCLVISIPVGISLGTVGVAEREGLSIGGLDLLTFLDDVTNIVLMPVCAFFACFVIGWIVGPRRAMDEMEDGATKLGFLRKIFPAMVRFLTPALILVVEVGGVVDKIKAATATGKPGHWIVVLTAYALLGVIALTYFLCFKKTDTGDNSLEEAPVTSEQK